MATSSATDGPTSTLDDVRDFMYTALRSMERFSTELKTTVEALNALQAKDAWLEQAHDQLQKGKLFVSQQMQQWQHQTNRMDVYMASVRELADQMALQDLKGVTGVEVKEGEDARVVHPELQRFKQEKIARIVGKYGGSPAFGGMVMLRPEKNVHLNATASPAAREIQYSKSENKDASQLADVMRFKVAKKEQGLSGWQEEMTTRKGQTYLEERQARGVTTTPVSHEVAPINAELKHVLENRQAAMSALDEQAAALTASSSKQQAAAPSVTGELAAKFASRLQQANKDALSCPETTVEALPISATSANSTLTAGPSTPAPAAVALAAHTQVASELDQALLRRKKTQQAHPEPAGEHHHSTARSPPSQGDGNNSSSCTPWQHVRLQSRSPATETPAAARPSTASPDATPELLARLQKVRSDEDEATPS